MAKMPSREVRAARWIEFAEFMESLPEHKFEHRNWCEPDHTCKTNACVAGWAAINYTEQAKTWLDLIFEAQKFRASLGKNPSKTNLDKYNSLYQEADKFDPNTMEGKSKNWAQLGRQALYLTYRTSEVLFYPSHNFWFEMRQPATSKDIALIFRYMATFPGSLGKKFDRERMQKVVDAYNLPSVTA